MLRRHDLAGGLAATADVDVPLAGTNVDGFEYKVNCGAGAVNATSGTATITGERHSPLHAPRPRDRRPAAGPTGSTTTVRIDQAIPVNTHLDAQHRLAQRARSTVPVTGDRRGLARRTPSGASTAAPGHLERHRDRRRHRHAHALHRGRRRRRQPQDDRSQTVQHRQHAPGRHDGHRPVGWQHAGASTSRSTAPTRDSGVDHVEWQLDARPARLGPRRHDRLRSTRQRHAHASRPASSTRSATTPRGRPSTSGRHRRPDRHDRASRPAWYTTADGQRQHHRHRQPRLATSRGSSGSLEDGAARRRRRQPGHGPVPVTVSRRRRAHSSRSASPTPTTASWTGTRTWSRSTRSPRST